MVGKVDWNECEDPVISKKVNFKNFHFSYVSSSIVVFNFTPSLLQW